MHKIENLTVEDYDLVRQKLQDWYPLFAGEIYLPRIFFKHFSFTSFIISNAEDVLGVMIAFPSLYQANVGCIHILFTNPRYKEEKIEKKLLNLFKDSMSQYRVNKLEYVMDPAHTPFIDICNTMELETKTGDKVTNGISCFTDYNGKGQDRAIYTTEWELPPPPQQQQQARQRR